MRERILGIYVEHHRGLREHARAEDARLPDVPDEYLRALVGGVAELVQQCVLESPAGDVPIRLRSLTPTLVSFATTVLTGGRDTGAGLAAP